MVWGVRIRLRVQIVDEHRRVAARSCVRRHRSGHDAPEDRQRRGGIGNIAVGALAIGGLACGLFTLGGASIGLLVAVGGAALGLGVSVGGLAVGSIAVGGLAVGFVYAIGGGAFGPAAIDGRHCDEAARAFVHRWLDVAPPSCR